MAETVVGIKLEATDEISGKIDAIKKKFSGLSNIGDTLVNVGKQMAILGGAITAPFVAAAKAFGDFEQSMKDVQVVSNATQAEFELLSNAAKKIGESTKFSAKEAADGLYSLASAGLSAEQQVKTLQSVTDLAAATNSKFASTSETIVSTVNQFGLAFDDAGRVADVFAGAISGSMATMDKLAASMRYAGTITSTLGMELEDTTAYLMSLYDAGYKGEQAGTVIRGALTSLIKPSNEAGSALEGLGINLEDLAKSSDPLRLALNAMEKAGVDTTTIMTVFGQEAGPGMASLLKQGTGALDDYEAGLRSSSGVAEKMAKDQVKTFSGMIKILKSKIDGVMIGIGEAIVPIIEKVVAGVSNMIETWNRLPEPLKKGIVQFTAMSGAVLLVGGGITALIGIILKGVAVWQSFGVAMAGITTKLPFLGTAIASVKMAFSSFQASLATGLKLAGIVALLVIIDKINGALRDMNAETIAVADNMNEKMGGIVDTSKTWYESFLSMIPLIGQVGDTMHASRISGDLAEIVKITGENTAAFVTLVLKARDFENVSFSQNVNDLTDIATKAKEAGGIYQQFGTNVDLVKTALAATIIELEKQGKPVENLKIQWGGVIDNFDAFVETEKRTMELAAQLATQLTETGNVGAEAATKISEGVAGVTFEPISEKAKIFAENITKIMGDGGELSKDAIMEKMALIDFSPLETKVKDTADSLFNVFSAAGYNSLKALESINTLGFDTLELTFSETAKKTVEYFVVAGNDAARGLGVVNDLSFSTLDEKVTNVSQSIMETLTDAGVNSVLAMEIINSVDFSGLKPTTEETKNALIKAFEQAGYSSTEALEKVNNIDLDGLVQESQKTAGNVKDQFKSAAEQTLSEFQKLNEYKFDRLQTEANAFNTQNMQDQLAAVEAKINAIDGRTITVYTEVVEK